MKIDKNRLDVVLARKCMSLRDLRPFLSPCTLSRINAGKDVRTKTVGAVAKVLGVDVLEILEGIA